MSTASGKPSPRGSYARLICFICSGCTEGLGARRCSRARRGRLAHFPNPRHSRRALHLRRERLQERAEARGALAERRDADGEGCHSSPSFFTEAEVERLFERLEALFEAAARSLRAATLTEYRAAFLEDSRAA